MEEVSGRTLSSGVHLSDFCCPPPPASQLRCHCHSPLLLSVSSAQALGLSSLPQTLQDHLFSAQFWWEFFSTSWTWSSSRAGALSMKPVEIDVMKSCPSIQSLHGVESVQSQHRVGSVESLHGVGCVQSQHWVGSLTVHREPCSSLESVILKQSTSDPAVYASPPDSTLSYQFTDQTGYIGFGFVYG